MNSESGPQARETPWLVPLSDLAVDEELVAAAVDAVRSGWWSMGPRVAQFEEEFAEVCGARYAIAVSSGTAALHLALLACGCGPGDEVIVPSLNFVAAANAIALTGAVPVFCDIVGPSDLNLAPEDLERAVGPRTKAVVALHYGGFPCDMAAVGEIAKRFGLTVIEDAAHAPGARWRGDLCGTIGRAGCFSFFSNKNIATAEGGMVVTHDVTIAERIRLLRSHGMTTMTWDRHRGHAHTYDVVEHGFNYRLDEIRAAIGRVQLQRLPYLNAARARISMRYREALEGIDGLTMPFGGVEGADTSSAHHLAVVVLPRAVSRDAVRTSLEHLRIQTSVHYPPIHRFSHYARLPSQRPLPQTENVGRRVMTLPLYSHMEDKQIDAVTEALRTVL